MASDRADVLRAVDVYSGAVLRGCMDGKKPMAYYASRGVDGAHLKTAPSLRFEVL